MGKTSEDVLHFADHPGISYPVVPGHEISGFVHSLGSEAVSAAQVGVGDRVMVYPWLGCLSDCCSVCASGDTNYCPGITREMGLGIDGGYSEYVTVPDYRYVLKLPDNIPFSMGALLPCSGLTAYAAIQKCVPTVARVRRWDKGVVVAVVGLGGLGQWALKLLPLCLGKEQLTVVGIDVSARKIEMVKDCGLVDRAFVLSLQGTVEEQVEKFTRDLPGNHANVVLDFVNSTTTFSLCVQLMGKMAVHVMVGLHGGLGELKLPLAATSGCTHVGCMVGTLEQLRELVDLVSGTEGIPPPTVKCYKLSAAGQALRDLEAGLLDGRAILDMSGTD